MARGEAGRQGTDPLNGWRALGAGTPGNTKRRKWNVDRPIPLYCLPFTEFPRVPAIFGDAAAQGRGRPSGRANPMR